jgi:23S rRNA (cytidine1920-2'-O)/16S rRNA (cytidine1409-2'-O)-methyltransferase
MMKKRQRADIVLYEQGYFESRAKARAAIEAGCVMINGSLITKPSHPIALEDRITAQAPFPWVSRGGVKLAYALTHFDIDIKDHFCLDVGASTGGFTDVLLYNDAQHVVCVDVGQNQLHEKLRQDPRVTSLESQDIRNLVAADLSQKPTRIVIDASFISLSLILPHVDRLAAVKCELIALIKPQYEAGVAGNKKGIVREIKIHDQVCLKIKAEIEKLNWRVQGLVESPITGGNGNREFLIYATR